MLQTDRNTKARALREQANLIRQQAKKVDRRTALIVRELKQARALDAQAHALEHQAKTAAPQAPAKEGRPLGSVNKDSPQWARAMQMIEAIGARSRARTEHLESIGVEVAPLSKGMSAAEYKRAHWRS